MDFQQLIPIETKRTDSASGTDYIFHAVPPVDFTTLRLLPDIEAKDFVLIFCWQVLAGGWDIEKFPGLKQQTSQLLPILKEGVQSIGIQFNEVDSEASFSYSYSLVLVRANELKSSSQSSQPSAEFMASLENEVLHSYTLAIAMDWYIDLNRTALDELARERKIAEGLGEMMGEPNPSTNRLFPNSKSFESNQWGSPKFLSDNLSRLVRKANYSDAIEQYESVDSRVRKRESTYKVQNKQAATELIFDKEKLAINTAEKFAEKLMKLRDAKVLQTFFALMKWANMQDSPIFHDVPVSEVMGLVLKASSGNKFNTPQRKEFSEILEFLASMTITVSQIGEQRNSKTGKVKPVLREEKGVKIFRLEATYSVKREFQSIPKESLQEDIHFDRSVIKSFSGELLPGKSHLLLERASVYFDSLLHLDANKDSKAIVMGFQLQTRFNQFKDKNQYIEMDRASLIDLCDYTKTNDKKAAVATQQLKNNLDKLIKAGIISKYSGLTNNNADKVKITPPKLQEQKKAN